MPDGRRAYLIPGGQAGVRVVRAVRRGSATPAGDVYAATATFYECLTGRPPFSGDSAERLLYQHLAEPVPLQPVPEPLRPAAGTPGASTG